jgi:hypothetical protein
VSVVLRLWLCCHLLSARDDGQKRGEFLPKDTTRFAKPFFSHMLIENDEKKRGKENHHSTMHKRTLSYTLIVNLICPGGSKRKKGKQSTIFAYTP